MNTTTESPSMSSVTEKLPSLTDVFFATPETLILTSGHENGSYHVKHTPPSAESLAFVLIPLIVVLTVALVSGVAIYCIQRRQRLDSLRHTLIPMYSFTPADDDEWGVLLDNNGHSSQEFGHSR
ncbi:hypothetical protein Ocin01_06042 [Orchesella cincta]|uniref:Uncharacterized protein n=1 Tax=Orchesella cincta TaxID=48709 RepID=A0A1D2N5U3_ORCCI|nr:hypothetical protein Ocin01_06042 [Orchesella cincta]